MIEESYYEGFEIDESNPKTSWSQIIHLAGTGHRILDIGCWIGKLAEKLKSNGNTVVGVEINPQWAKRAGEHCNVTLCGDVEDEEFWRSVPDAYDVIILGDILEHLYDPWNLLKRLHEKLNPNGYVLCSIPNVANWRPRLELMLGSFTYKPTGIIFYHHLRFFTRASAEAMFLEAGFKMEYFGVTCYRLPLFLAKLFPTLFAIQFVYKLLPNNTSING